MIFLEKILFPSLCRRNVERQNFILFILERKNENIAIKTMLIESSMNIEPIATAFKARRCHIIPRWL